MLVKNETYGRCADKAVDKISSWRETSQTARIILHGANSTHHRSSRPDPVESQAYTTRASGQSADGKGIAQAKALGERLMRETFTALYSSDLGRAVQTAQMIAAATGHEIVTDPRLRERHLGHLSRAQRRRDQGKISGRISAAPNCRSKLCYPRGRECASSR